MDQRSGIFRKNALPAVALIVAITTTALGWILVRDQSRILNRLSFRTQTAWEKARVCVQQRNAILRLTLRARERDYQSNATKMTVLRADLDRQQKLLNNGGAPADIIAMDRDLEKQTSELLGILTNGPQVEAKFEKLADLLARAQNRLALNRMQYNRAARRLQGAMGSLAGLCVGRLCGIELPAQWGS